MNSRRGSTSSPISVVKASRPRPHRVRADLEQGSILLVERCVRELVGVHLPQALVALDGEPLLAELQQMREKRNGAEDFLGSDSPGRLDAERARADTRNFSVELPLGASSRPSGQKSVSSAVVKQTTPDRRALRDESKTAVLGVG